MKILDKAVIIKDDQYLVLLRSSDSKFFPDQWDFPGGKREQKETPQEAVVREVKEETNLDVETTSILSKYTYTEHDTLLDFTVHKVKMLSNLIKLSKDHSQFTWKTKEELLKMSIAPIVRMFLED